MLSTGFLTSLGNLDTYRFADYDSANLTSPLNRKFVLTIITKTQFLVY